MSVPCGWNLSITSTYWEVTEFTTNSWTIHHNLIFWSWNQWLTLTFIIAKLHTVFILALSMSLKPSYGCINPKNYSLPNTYNTTSESTRNHNLYRNRDWKSITRYYPWATEPPSFKKQQTLMSIDIWPWWSGTILIIFEI